MSTLAPPPAESYAIPDLVAEINALLQTHLSEYGLIENIGRALRRTVRNPELLTAEQRVGDPDHYARHTL